MVVTFPQYSDLDYIGTESCMDLQNTNHVDKDNHEFFKHVNIKAKRNTTTKVFPPPIPLLARTQNLASHMPWVLKRYYTSEGRLILKEEKVKHHEYFRAHRANGRLTLHLVNVHVDDHVNVPFDDDDHDDDVSEEAEPTSSDPHDSIDDRFDEEYEEENVASINNVAVADDEVSVEYDDSDVVVAGGSGRVKFLNCGSVRSAGPTCNIFGVPVHPIRTVHG